VPNESANEITKQFKSTDWHTQLMCGQPNVARLPQTAVSDLGMRTVWNGTTLVAQD